jgi:gamma-glutamyltranspeptidase/glutathione hydrolase
MTMTKRSKSRAGFALGALAMTLLGAGAAPPAAAELAMTTCQAGTPNLPAACNPGVVPGDRREGWMAQGRSEVMARNGIVAASQPLAAQAGLRVLMKGGNAIDAAVATAATLNLVEPMMIGLAGDLFTIIYVAKEHKFHVLNASGMTYTGMTVPFMNSHGYKWDPRNNGFGSGMPQDGILSVTIPGAIWGWAEVVQKYGNLTLKDDLAPATDYAINGFPVSEGIAHDWHLPKAVNSPMSELGGCCTALDPDSVKTWYINGKPPVAGQIFKNPDLAKTFKLLSAGGRDVFYKGEIAKAIVAKAKALGSTMTMEDMANYKGEWVDPVSYDYHGYTLLEAPPPSQGWAAAEMLNILQNCVGSVFPGETLAKMGPTDPRYWHMLIEAKTIAFVDLNKYNGDPDFNPTLLTNIRKTYLSQDYAKQQCGRLSAGKTVDIGQHKGSQNADTIVLTTADRWGNMVSWVNSNSGGFGSGITIPGYGFVLHNRGQQFVLNPDSPNRIEPHKRPYNTLSTGFLYQTGTTEGQKMTLVLMGGDEQAQGHAQMVVNMVDLGANVQMSTDMARFHHNQVADKVDMESNLFKLVGAQLKAWGHEVEPANGSSMGGYQAILMTPDPNLPPVTDFSKASQAPLNGYYRAGSDSRKDGEAVGW